jgi:cob(I)alamin adenosyltransferase
MKIYTKTGDQGTTSLYGGQRIDKNDLRIISYGSIDELNAHLGLLRDMPIADTHKYTIHCVQETLFVIGSHLATNSKKMKLTSSLPKISQKILLHLETQIDEMNNVLSPMTHFILPGGHHIVSHCHIARTVCRRAERNVCGLAKTATINPEIIPILNRLSDYLFVLARKLAHELNVEEIKWIPKK